MASTFCILPLLAALTGYSSSFCPQNKDQDLLVSLFTTYNKEKSMIRALKFNNVDEIQYSISPNIGDMNDFVQNKNLAFQLQPSNFQHPLYLASFMDILVFFLSCKEQTLEIAEVKYPVIHAPNAILHQIGCLQIIELKSADVESVFITIADEPVAGFDLFKKVMSLQETLLLQHSTSTIEVIFPMVEINNIEDTKFIENLGVNGNRLVQPLQKTVFKMNHRGCASKISSLRDIRFMGGSIPTTQITINRPFIIWCKRGNEDISFKITLPLFTVYADESCWKKPSID